MYVGGCVWYLKISRDPDHAAEREWYQIEAEHMRRRLGTIRKFLRCLGGAWHVKTSPIGNALRKHNVSDVCSTFLNLLASLGFFPCISLPTRVNSQSKTLIDNFFCNDLSLIEKPEVIFYDISDHLPISVRFNFNLTQKPNCQSKNSVFDFRKIDALRIRVQSELTNFHETQSAESACNQLTGVLSRAITDLSIKKVNRRNVPMQPWISYDILHSINKKMHCTKNILNHLLKIIMQTSKGTGMH